MTGSTLAEREAWIVRARELRAIADRVRAMRTERWRRLIREAGLGDSGGSVLHNALIGLEQGRPWRGVNYSKAREARRLERTMFDGDRVLSRWHARTMPR